jgi:hypothetical protein
MRRYVAGLVLSGLAALGLSCRSEPAAPEPATATTRGQAPAAPAAPALRGELQRIVDAYRKTIVLAEDENELDDRGRRQAGIVGRVLFQQNHQRLTALGGRLAEEIAAARSSAFSSPPGETLSFLALLEDASDWHDADKLAFRPVVSELLEALPEREGASPPERELRRRLLEDQKALQEIQSLYEKELEKIFGRFETRARHRARQPG